MVFLRLSPLAPLACALLALLASGPQILSQAPGDPRLSPAELRPGQSVVPLNGPWKFTVGDSFLAPTGNPDWAEPAFDDSGWEAVDLTPRPGSIDPFNADPRYVPGWTAMRHPGYTGWAWYRLWVTVRPTQGEQLALAGPIQVDDAYQVYANGKLLGSYGRFVAGRDPVVFWTQPSQFDLPIAASPSGIPVKMLLAFRVWMGPMGLLHSPDAGGLRYAPLLGEKEAIAAQIQLQWLELLCQSAYHPLEAGLFLLLAIVAASLLLFDRSDPVYPWLAFVLGLTAIQDLWLTITNLTNLVTSETYFLVDLAFLGPITLGAWGMVWWIWFQLQRPVWVPKAIGILTVAYIVFQTAGGEFFRGAIPHSLRAIGQGGSLTVRALFVVLLILIVGRAIREQGREGWLVLPAVTLVALSQFSSELLVLHVPVLWAPLGVSVFVSEVAHVLLAAAIALLLLRRLWLTVHRQRLMAIDRKQAQELQQVILAEARDTHSGLVVQTEYRPALDVGGDFFQVIPREAEGDLLIVVGDVTGKGLRAGMLVALLVGAIRTAAEMGLGPEALLRSLNNRLAGRSDGAATCMVLSIAQDGKVDLANAGHMPPYLNGEPLMVEGALPLGIAEQTQFGLACFRLAEGDRLTLMSDGVVEATNAAGQLFGFERVQELVRQAKSAAEVVKAAQAFGQEDDISVIFVTRTAVLQPAAV